jgi:hypothetical protein
MDTVILVPQRIMILSQTRIHSLTGSFFLITQLNITALMRDSTTSLYTCLWALVLIKALVLVHALATLMTDYDLNLLYAEQATQQSGRCADSECNRSPLEVCRTTMPTTTTIPKQCFRASIRRKFLILTVFMPSSLKLTMMLTSTNPTNQQ